jgi:hypothetical protein
MQCYSLRLSASRVLLFNCYNNTEGKAPKQQHVRDVLPLVVQIERTLRTLKPASNAQNTALAQLRSCRGRAALDCFKIASLMLPLARGIAKCGDEQCTAVSTVGVVSSFASATPELELTF